MSSSKILKPENDCTVTPYSVREMGTRPQASLERVEHLAQDIIRKARAQKESIEMEAYQAGLLQGQEQGQKMAIKRIEPLFDALRQALDEIASLRKTYTERHQEQLLSLVVMIAEKVVHREVQLEPELILDVVRAASMHLMETDEVRVRLHPSDFEYIRDVERILSRQLVGKKQVHIIEDASIERGGVIIGTEFGDIDATIRSQIELIRDALVEDD